MKTTKLFLTMSTVALFFTSCYTEAIIVADTSVAPHALVISLVDVLSDYELWYVDVHQPNANGETPFMQLAFTVSFDKGIVYATNNLIGLGEQGYGLGIAIGYYNTNGFDLTIIHDFYGFNSF